jgi:hypothetical protein
MKQQGGKVLIEFFASNDIGEYLDRGTKRAKTDTPPRAMVSSLEDWINTRPTLRSIAQQKQPNKPFNKVRQSFAYAIAKSILRKGIISRYGHKGSKWATEVLGANNEILERNITKAVEQVLGRNAEVYVTKQINNSLKGKA